MICGQESTEQTTFISVYRPVVPTPSGGTTTYDQQLRGLEGDRETREALSQDLSRMVRGKQDEGHNIVIGMDANQNIYHPRILRFMRSLNLKDALLSTTKSRCPPTTRRNETGQPIDIIMCSQHMSPIAAGYDYKAGSTSDHAWMWADFTEETLFGHLYQSYVQATIYEL